MRSEEEKWADRRPQLTAHPSTVKCPLLGRQFERNILLQSMRSGAALSGSERFGSGRNFRQSGSWPETGFAEITLPAALRRTTLHRRGLMARLVLRGSISGLPVIREESLRRQDSPTSSAARDWQAVA